MEILTQYLSTLTYNHQFQYWVFIFVGIKNWSICFHRYSLRILVLTILFSFYFKLAAHSSPTCKNIFGTQKNDIHVLIWICRVVVHTLQNIAAKGSEIWPQAPNKYLKTHWTCMSRRNKMFDMPSNTHIHRLRKGNKNIFVS